MAVSTTSAMVIIHFGPSEPTVNLCRRLHRLHDEGNAVTVVVVANDLTPRPGGLPESTTWLQPERNLGYAGGALYAISKLQVDSYILLNNDIELDQATFTGCLFELRRPEVRAGVVAPVLRFPDGRFQSGPGRITRWARRPAMAFDCPPSSIRCDWVSGAAMFLDATALEAVSFEDSYFLGAEDVDLCVRMRRAGFAVICAGAFSAYHERSREIGSMWRYYGPRNRLWFVKRCFGPTAFAIAAVDVLGRTARTIIGDLLLQRDHGVTAMSIRGFLDGLSRLPPRGSGPRMDEPVPLSKARTSDG